MSVTGLTQGEIFADRYRVGRPIATGGMGAVYEVVHIETEKRRALKVMLPHVIESADMRERFRREARITSTIDSEFIVEVFDAGIDERTGSPFLVMELLRGEELSKTLRRVGHLSAEQTVTYLGQAAIALDKTHAASIVHRDLKPGNLFLTTRDDGSPRIKILDFGIAKVVSEATLQSASTAKLGTPLYMAPEQFSGGQIGPSADILSLGLIAYTLLVGEAYWSHEADHAVSWIGFATARDRADPEPASQRALRKQVTLPRAFDAWFARATARDPQTRFPSASQTIAELAAALGVAPMTPWGLSGSVPSLPASSQAALRARTGFESGAGRQKATLVGAMRRRLRWVALAGALGVALASWMIAQRGPTAHFKPVPSALSPSAQLPREPLSPVDSPLAMRSSREPLEPLAPGPSPSALSSPAAAGSALRTPAGSAGAPGLKTSPKQRRLSPENLYGQD
jgi:eukaryotic-like serine/threonine-protein kinase